jgi:phosphoribosyl-AMP cyclohydrolase
VSGDVAWLDAVQFNADGLVPVIAQDAGDQTILMMAWMNAEALSLTVETGQVVYYSRSRQRLWRKGESSGNVQQLRDMYLDCDGDVLVVSVEQIGGVACHTGRKSCFFKKLEEGSWQDTLPVLKSPSAMYGKKE